MAEETKEQAEQQQEPPADGAQGTEGGQEGNPQGGEGVIDKHGHPGISQGKYERDIKERDEKIAELQAQIEQAAKSEEAAAELAGKIDALKAEMADKDTDHALELAGCVDLKAAKAVLDDCGGDVAKLKDSKPYLFKQEQPAGSTGLRPAGARRITKEEIRAEKDLAKRRKLISENLDLWDN